MTSSLGQQQTVSMIKAPNKKMTAMQRLDAADGKMDGKYYGDRIVDGKVGHSGHTAHAHGKKRPPKQHTVTKFTVTHGGMTEEDDDAVYTCGLKDPDHPDRTCLHTCLGSLALRRHQAACAFQRVQCPNEKCGTSISAGSLDHHLELCRHQRVECFMCQARYFRMDADYHHSMCPKMDIKCPLSCGLVLPRGELDHHIRMDYMLHSHEVLECQDYLAEDHPSRIYGVLLRRLKELRARVELAQRPGLLRSYDHELSPVYTPSKINTFNEQYSTLPSPAFEDAHRPSIPEFDTHSHAESGFEFEMVEED